VNGKTNILLRLFFTLSSCEKALRTDHLHSRTFLKTGQAGTSSESFTRADTIKQEPRLVLCVSLSAFKMSIWDKFTGRKSQPSTTSPSSSDTTTDSFQSTPFDPTQAQDVSSFLTGPSFADPSQLHPLAGLNQQTLDYLSLEDSTLSDLPGAQSALPSRGWSDDLCYGTGVTYLTALTMGGAWGLQEGLRRSNGQPPKLRLNSVLNAVTRRGPFLGNSAGVIALVYNGFNSFIGHLRGRHDSANSVLAGALSGMIFKSTRGLRPMMISGGIVATVAGAWAVCSSLFYFVLIHTNNIARRSQEKPSFNESLLMP
jgi:import inner membrane translocase subunit TIM23